MKPGTFNRLHTLRMENDAVRFAQMDAAPRFAALAGRHEAGTAPRAVVVHQLFQTPPAIAARLVALLELKGGERILEPSAGLGRLLDAIGGKFETTAVEIAADCAAELYRQDRPGVRILQRDFLTVTPEETGLFDAVAMNPPFTMRADIRHIEHALKFLRPGGRLAALCLNTERRAAAFKGIAKVWHPLPYGEFKAEGTNVSAVLMLIET